MKEIARSVLGPRLKPATLPSRASTRSSKITQSAALPAKVDGPTGPPTALRREPGCWLNSTFGFWVARSNSDSS